MTITLHVMNLNMVCLFNNMELPRWWPDGYEPNYTKINNQYEYSKYIQNYTHIHWDGCSS